MKKTLLERVKSNVCNYKDISFLKSFRGRKICRIIKRKLKRYSKSGYTTYFVRNEFLISDNVIDTFTSITLIERQFLFEYFTNLGFETKIYASTKMYENALKISW